jgi:hypothetical protein
VSEAHTEARGVHRRKTRQGQIVLVRDMDDITSSWEDALEGRDGLTRQKWQGSFKMEKHKYTKRTKEYRSV